LHKLFTYTSLIIAIGLLAYSQECNSNNYACSPWSQLAHQDLEVIYDTIQKNASAPVTYQTDNFKTWYQAGFKKALAITPQANSYQEYVKALHYYVDGLQTPHFYLKPLLFTKQEQSQNSSESIPQFAVKSFGKNSIWISIPNFTDNNKLSLLAKKIRKFRHKNILVLDMRGNSGGSNKYGRQIIFNLYGLKFLRSLGNKFPLNQEWIEQWRVSSGNLKAASERKGPEFVQQMQTALQQHQQLILYRTRLIPFSQQPTSSVKNPVTAKVFLLTDQRCFSACWHFTRETTSIPGVTQIGQPTKVGGYYGDVRSINLPSGIMQFTFPMKTFINPTAHLDTSFKPKYYYLHDMNNERALQSWILQIANHQPNPRKNI
jgi:hypothetical protein